MADPSATWGSDDASATWGSDDASATWGSDDASATWGSDDASATEASLATPGGRPTSPPLRSRVHQETEVTR
jgi:hypothetical protein